MRRSIQFCSLLLLLVFGGEQAHAQQPAAALDVLHLNAGASVPCRVLSSTDTAVKIEYRAGNAVVNQVREVPWTEVSRIDFAMDDEFRALLNAADYTKDGVKVEMRWKAVAPMLSRPNHPAGDLGLVLARLSLSATNPKAKQDALAICQQIAQSDWSPPRRDQAKWLRVQLLTVLQRSEEALTEARALSAESTLDPAIAMPVLLYLAQADIVALKKLEEENPVWMEDDTVRPDRERLFHAALDGCLKPSLFYGTLEAVAAQGLWTAVQLLEFDRSLTPAADTARDLIHLYPNATETTKAKEWLAANKLPLEAPEVDIPKVDAPKKKPDEPAETKREPGVTRRSRIAKPEKKPSP